MAERVFVARERELAHLNEFLDRALRRARRRPRLRLVFVRPSKSHAGSRRGRGSCGWFTEGFDTADLTEAKALLEELS